MRRALILTLAFVVSTLLGVVLLLLIVIAIGFVQMAMQQRNHSGIVAVAALASPRSQSS